MLKLNSQRSLPMTLFPKQSIYAKVESDPKIGRWRKPIVKIFRLGVYIVKYYKTGIQETYNIYKNSKNFKMEINKLTSIDLKNSSSPITELYKYVEFQDIKVRNTHLENNNGKDTSNGKPITSHIPITRKQLVEYYRRNQVWKLPRFALIAFIFEEITALLCYIWPNIAPHNCLSPGGYKKISNSLILQRNKFQAKNKTKKMIENSLEYNSPFSLSTNELKLKLRNSTASKVKLFIYSKFQNNKKFQEKSLNEFYQYIYLNDRILLENILKPNLFEEKNSITRLTYRELAQEILERQLYEYDEDINKMVNDQSEREILLLRLIIYLSYIYDDCIGINGTQFLHSEKWGAANMNLLENRGTVSQQLVNNDTFSNIHLL
ncbi:hypothetical protein TBLA_0B03600 [Henningerozyma blattae CBS 6284]|uniref:Uncharacterized protein n=1 Tax=Henningerozyma blattae (strain ATCC 34711 / CBS 6284 / DSM 70876 / NBRC 10599 / NRRL Y-10934 / UCD 77-7) TaxID=1071380 RepID=I2GYJ8_HENB6|nr:hypothetical protein TBLA_0B03600 [Tetrapisispora blattae CBS 6284]CCH59200.1 hypothetical protein TBLA_0B03600 [Tetrapisispora blattae CBS 6284]